MSKKIIITLLSILLFSTQIVKSDVKVDAYVKDKRAVIYHPSTWTKQPTPLIFFAPGWNSTDHLSYKTLLEFIASHGYSVVFIPCDGGNYSSQLKLFDGIVKEYKSNLNTKKVGVIGHSSGGGFAFKVLEHLIAKSYGENGRFMSILDAYFAQYMNKKNIQSLNNTNIQIIQFGNKGKGTDPRILLNLYQLLNGKNIDKNYIVLSNDNDHSYPARQNIQNMQNLLKPLEAIMAYTFDENSKVHHQVALEGEGKINPYLNAYQKVLPINQYAYNCKYANKWHMGPNQKVKSDIENCGTPTIKPN